MVPFQHSSSYELSCTRYIQVSNKPLTLHAFVTMQACLMWHIPDSKVHEAHLEPTWGRLDPGGPHVGPMNLVIWDVVNIEAETKLAAITQEVFFKCIFWNENVSILLKISLNFVPKFLINNIPTLVQIIMISRRFRGKYGNKKQSYICYSLIPLQIYI